MKAALSGEAMNVVGPQVHAYSLPWAALLRSEGKMTT